MRIPTKSTFLFCWKQTKWWKRMHGVWLYSICLLILTRMSKMSDKKGFESALSERPDFHCSHLGPMPPKREHGHGHMRHFPTNVYSMLNSRVIGLNQVHWSFTEYINLHPINGKYIMQHRKTPFWPHDKCPECKLNEAQFYWFECVSMATLSQ